MFAASRAVQCRDRSKVAAYHAVAMRPPLISGMLLLGSSVSSIAQRSRDEAQPGMCPRVLCGGADSDASTVTVLARRALLRQQFADSRPHAGVRTAIATQVLTHVYGTSRPLLRLTSPTPTCTPSTSRTTAGLPPFPLAAVLFMDAPVDCIVGLRPFPAVTLTKLCHRLWRLDACKAAILTWAAAASARKTT
eukprot:2373556-Rhodomonas_salina.2